MEGSEVGGGSVGGEGLKKGSLLFTNSKKMNFWLVAEKGDPAYAYQFKQVSNLHILAAQGGC
jgi:hypothetical protein